MHDAPPTIIPTKGDTPNNGDNAPTKCVHSAYMCSKTLLMSYYSSDPLCPDTPTKGDELLHEMPDKCTIATRWIHQITKLPTQFVNNLEANISLLDTASIQEVVTLLVTLQL